MDFMFLMCSLVVFAALIAFFVGLGMLVFSKDKKQALLVIVFSLMVVIIGFGTCVNGFKL